MAPPLKIEPLNMSDFAPFGMTLTHSGGKERLYFLQQFEDFMKKNTSVWVNNPPKVNFPFSISKLEKHPFSPQVFVPMHECNYVAIACLSDSMGYPDVTTLKAFWVVGPTIVIYSKNIWHHGLLASRDDLNFCVVQNFIGQDDDIFFKLDEEILLIND
tara:strand:+ start:3631 stop:4104 length:474 start_codon:yes stop_codon:yes gene_type:complete